MRSDNAQTLQAGALILAFAAALLLAGTGPAMSGNADASPRHTLADGESAIAMRTAGYMWDTDEPIEPPSQIREEQSERRLASLRATGPGVASGRYFFDEETLESLSEAEDDQDRPASAGESRA